METTENKKLTDQECQAEFREVLARDGGNRGPGGKEAAIEVQVHKRKKMGNNVAIKRSIDDVQESNVDEVRQEYLRIRRNDGQPQPSGAGNWRAPPLALTADPEPSRAAAVTSGSTPGPSAEPAVAVSPATPDASAGSLKPSTAKSEAERKPNIKKKVDVLRAVEFNFAITGRAWRKRARRSSSLSVARTARLVC